MAYWDDFCRVFRVFVRLVDSTDPAPMSPTDIPLDSSSSRRRPFRMSSALLVIVILVLVREQRREARLREAVAAYQRRSEGRIAAFIGGWLPVDLVWPEGTPLEGSNDVPVGEVAGSRYHQDRDVLE